MLELTSKDNIANAGFIDFGEIENKISKIQLQYLLVHKCRH